VIYELKLDDKQLTGIAQLLVRERDAAAAVHQLADSTLAAINEQCSAQTAAAQAAVAEPPVLTDVVDDTQLVQPAED